MTRHLPPTVCLDSSAVRRIREEKKLTQLYVSKVVGVTTDTISRWENNRYPTVKRENALRLAEALETEVEDILEKNGDASPELEGERSFSRRHPFAWLLVVGLIGLGLLVVFWQSRQQEMPAVSLEADRWLPHFAAPGSVIPVHIHLQTDPGLKGFILREHFPAGWKLIEASPPPSSLDNEKGTARWIVKPGEEERDVAYLVQVDKQATMGSTASMEGEVVLGPEGRSEPVPVGGSTQLTVAPYHWADLNGDGQIDDGEMLQASDIFDIMKGVHLDWNQLERIWDSGSYRWDIEKSRFIPVKSPTPASTEPAPKSSEG